MSENDGILHEVREHTIQPCDHCFHANLMDCQQCDKCCPEFPTSVNDF